MKEIFKFIFYLLGQIINFWMSININGFYPFWYLVSLGLLVLLGTIFSGSVNSVGGIIGDWVKDKKIVKKKIIIKNKK